MANGAEQGAKRAPPAWRRCATNVVAAVTLLVRPPRLRPAKRWLLPTRQLIIAAVVAGPLFLAVMILFDATASSAAGKLPRWLISAFDEITDYGKSGWFLWPLGLLFLALAALPPMATRAGQLVVAALMVRVGFLFLAIGVPGLFVTVVKRLIGRARPFVTGSADPYVFRVFGWRAEYASLPSGHATTAFSVLVAFGVLWPRARPVLLIYALLIVASRVVVTAHYPTDVAAGALVGVVGALLVRRYFALRRLGFSIGPDGAPHTCPGPSWRRIKSVARGLLAS
jgi:undecaprenyl-diphosphatase